MTPFMLKYGHSELIPYNGSREQTEVRVTATSPVNVYVVKRGQYPDIQHSLASLDREYHVLTLVRPSAPWELVIENQSEEYVGGAFSVTTVQRVHPWFSRVPWFG